jgi:CRP-like cAMP-binding protein
MISPETLRRYPYFARVSDSLLKEIAMLSQEGTFRKGERLFLASDASSEAGGLIRKASPAESLMVLLDGEVDLVYSLAGNREVVVDTLVSGDLLGVASMVEPFEHTSTAIARRDGKFIRIEAAGLRGLCSQEPSLGFALMSQVARVLQASLQNARVQLAAQD